MSDSLPDPLTPPSADLGDFRYMQVDVRRLLTSDTWLTCTDGERAAAITLWLESWHQVPAGSIPDNDRALAKLSQAGMDWPDVKDGALRNWIKCSDGRLYHPIVCEKVNEVLAKKKSNRARTAKASEARWANRESDESTSRKADEDAEISVTESVTDCNREGEGEREGYTPPLTSFAPPPTGEAMDDTLAAQQDPEPDEPKPKRIRRTQIPDDWQPTEDGCAILRGKGYDERAIQNEADKFRDYCRGNHVLQADWRAKWRNWCRSDFCKPRAAGQSAGGNGADSHGLVAVGRRVVAAARERDRAADADRRRAEGSGADVLDFANWQNAGGL